MKSKIKKKSKKIRKKSKKIKKKSKNNNNINSKSKNMDPERLRRRNENDGNLFVGWSLACLTSQQHASVSQRHICSDN